MKPLFDGELEKGVLCLDAKESRKLILTNGRIILRKGQHEESESIRSLKGMTFAASWVGAWLVAAMLAFYYISDFLNLPFLYFLTLEGALVFSFFVVGGFYSQSIIVRFENGSWFERYEGTEKDFEKFYSHVKFENGCR